MITRLDEIVLLQLSQFLNKKLGFEVDSNNEQMVMKAIQERKNALKLTNSEMYVATLISSPKEFESFVEYLVIPETWFFRAENSLIALSTYLSDRDVLKKAHGCVHILSIPCSTGEEAYTIAMHLLDQEFKPFQFQVDALDISAHSLRVAARGIYTNNAFRAKNLTFRDRYFSKVHKGYQITSDIKKQVHFIQGNIFEPQSWNFACKKYDVIFCCNLLIYFNKERQSKAISILDSFLNPGGLLILGHAEAHLARSHHFIPYGMLEAFSFTREADSIKDVDQELSEYAIKSVHPNTLLHQPIFMQPMEKTILKEQNQGFISANDKADSGLKWSEVLNKLETTHIVLEKAEACIASRNYEEATDLCTKALKQFGENAKARYFLGYINFCKGHLEDAEKQFHKAIYLDTNHIESLEHLSTIYEMRQMSDKASIFKQRALRAKKREDLLES